MSEADTPQLDHDDIQALLRQACVNWQQRLRLQDWNVEVHVYRYHEMKQEALAYITYYEERKDAKMSLLAPIDVPLVRDRFLGNEAANYDISIVHELLHLHFYPLSDYENNVKRIAEEQVVNALSRCIVAAYASTVQPVIPPMTVDSVGHYL